MTIKIEQRKNERKKKLFPVKLRKKAYDKCDVAIGDGGIVAMKV